MKKHKRVLIISDLHTGHMVGLTPPPWQWRPAEGPDINRRNKFIQVQRECWDFYESAIKKYGPFDIVIANGDLIDGTGWRSGGTEQAVIDRVEQCEIAEYSIRKTMAPFTKLFVTLGTSYHTGEAEDWEAIIAENLGAQKSGGAHEWIDVNGIVFDVKHHVASSAIPHGRHTPVAREHLWNILWAERDMQPKAQVTIRSHVHYYNYCGGVTWLGMTTPALQGYGTKYGARRCSGIVDYGMVVFEVNGRKEYKWYPLIAKSKALVANVIKA